MKITINGKELEVDGVTINLDHSDVTNIKTWPEGLGMEMSFELNPKDIMDSIVEGSMTATESLDYLIDLYGWDPKTVKNVNSYARSLVEEILKTESEWVKMVRENCGEGEAEKYIRTMMEYQSAPRILVKGYIDPDIDLGVGGHIQVISEQSL